MSDKPFVSKVLKFPTGEPIAPEGCYLVTNVVIGKYGTFQLPIRICVDQTISPENLTSEIFSALAKYYGWMPNPTIKPVSENGLTMIIERITTVAGFVLPAPVEYHLEINPSAMVDVFITLASHYKWPRIGDSKDSEIVKYELLGNK